MKKKGKAIKGKSRQSASGYRVVKYSNTIIKEGNSMRRLTKDEAKPKLPLYLWSACLLGFIIGGILIISGVSSPKSDIPDYMTSKEKYVPITEPELQPQPQPQDFIGLINQMYGSWSSLFLFVVAIIPIAVVARAFSRALR